MQNKSHRSSTSLIILLLIICFTSISLNIYMLFLLVTKEAGSENEAMLNTGTQNDGVKTVEEPKAYVPKELVGIWKDNDYTIEISEDGQCTFVLWVDWDSVSEPFVYSCEVGYIDSYNIIITRRYSIEGDPGYPDNYTKYYSLASLPYKEVSSIMHIVMYGSTAFKFDGLNYSFIKQS